MPVSPEQVDRDAAGAVAAADAVTWLFAPGDRPALFAKADLAGADAVILDLEDAVAPVRRPEALAMVADWLSTGAHAWVRLTAPTPTDLLDGEVSRLAAAPGLDGVIVPKAASRESLEAIHDAFGRPVIALVETARGVLSARSIVQARGLLRLAFGELDFSLDSGIDDPDALRQVRTDLSVASAAARLAPPIDGVTTAIEDARSVERDAARARALGYTGKLCIHPAQLTPVRDGFAPTAQEVARARRVVDAAGDGAAVAADGQMIDAPVLARAQQVLARARPTTTAPPVERDVVASVREAFAGVPEGWAQLARLDPAYVTAFTAFTRPPATSVLSPAITALLRLAIACSPTTLDEGAVRRHVEEALARGARTREVLDVIELVSLLSIHSLTEGLPLVDALLPDPPAASPADGSAERRGGYWAAFERHFPGFHHQLAALLPQVDTAYRELSAALWREDGLDARWRELVFVVADLSTTHLFTEGAALHLGNAVHYGASVEEISEALALTLAVGGRAVEVGVPALLAAITGTATAHPDKETR